MLSKYTYISDLLHLEVSLFTLIHGVYFVFGIEFFKHSQTLLVVFINFGKEGVVVCCKLIKYIVSYYYHLNFLHVYSYILYTRYAYWSARAFTKYTCQSPLLYLYHLCLYIFNLHASNSRRKLHCYGQCIQLLFPD